MTKVSHPDMGNHGKEFIVHLRLWGDEHRDTGKGGLSQTDKERTIFFFYPVESPKKLSTWDN